MRDETIGGSPTADRDVREVLTGPPTTDEDKQYSRGVGDGTACSAD